MGSNGNTAFVWVLNFPSAIPGLQYFSPGIFPWEEIPLLLLRNNSRNAHLQICATSKKKKCLSVHMHGSCALWKEEGGYTCF